MVEVGEASPGARSKEKRGQSDHRGSRGAPVIAYEILVAMGLRAENDPVPTLPLWGGLTLDVPSFCESSPAGDPCAAPRRFTRIIRALQLFLVAKRLAEEGLQLCK